jgi:hypothetical protein
MTEMGDYAMKRSTTRFIHTRSGVIALGVAACLVACAVDRRDAAGTNDEALSPPCRTPGLCGKPRLPSVTTQHNDARRTGANLLEHTLDTMSVATAFGKLFEYHTLDGPLAGQIYAQPLYVSSVSTHLGRRDLVIVATEQNVVYAFDAQANPADRGSQLPIWSTPLGTPYQVEMFGAISAGVWPQKGITSTPVIDLARQKMYVVACEDNLGVPGFFLHRMDIRSGADEASAPIAPEKLVPYGFFTDRLTLDPRIHIQRAGLALARNQVIVAFASSLADYSLTPGDAYRGWVVALDKDSLTQTGVFTTTTYASAGGVWQAGAAPAVGTDGDVYLESGNGSGAPQEYANALVELDPSAGLAVLSALRVKPVGDNDYGSSGPMLLPGTPFVVSGGKDSVVIVSRQNAVNDVAQRVALGGTFDHQILGAPVYWEGPSTPQMFLWAGADKLRAFPVTSDPTAPLGAPRVATTTLTPNGYGAFLSLSADGATAGSGIVWANVVQTVTPLPSKSDSTSFHTTLAAYDASDVTRELWQSDACALDAVTGVARFGVPTVAGGRLYFASQEPLSNKDSAEAQTPTAHGYLAVYGLLPAARTCGPSDAGAGTCIAAPGQTPPPTWTDLYTTYFGPGGAGHCTSCHAPPGDPVAMTHLKFSDASPDSVYTGLTTFPVPDYAMTPLVSTSMPAASILGDPLQTPLIAINPTGALPRMPPGGAGCDPALYRGIEEWLAVGAHK